MKASMRKTSPATMPIWMSLVLLLTGSLLNSASSEATTVVSAVDISGDIELPVDGTRNIGTKKTPLDLANAQLDWLVSEGGSVDLEKVAIKHTSGDPNNLGIFAIDDIERGEVIMRIPVSFVLTSSK